MAGQLSDDGTMDTVIRCSECGGEQRYNFDQPEDIDQQVMDYREDNHVGLGAAIDAVGEKLYNEFVDWCIEDFEDSHECEKGADDEA